MTMDPDDAMLLRNIIATITYYDVLGFPMTAFEIWRHMIVAPSITPVTPQTWYLHNVSAMLERSEAKDYLAEKDGFYTLRGRTDLIVQRCKRERISVKKIEKLRRYVFILRIVPFVRMIALTGRLSYKNGEDESDLDVLIACQRGHIWMGRLLMTVMTQVMGVRRHGKHHANRVCLNYYVTDQSLEVPTKDLYSAHEYSFILPLYGRDVFAKFVRANRWIRDYKPHYIVHQTAGDLCYGDHPLFLRIRTWNEKLCGMAFLERSVKKIQRKKILANPKTQYDGARIVTTDDHLVFLPKPHGPRVYEQYKKRFDALELPWRVEKT